MVECAITYCQQAATQAVETPGGERVHVCPDHSDTFEPIPAAQCKGSLRVNRRYDDGGTSA